MHHYGKNVIVSVFDMYQRRIRVGYRYDHTEEYQAKKKSLFLFRYSLDMPGIHPRYGEYQSDTREVKKKKGENLTPGWSLTSWVKSPNLVSPCLCLSLSLSVFSFLHFALRLFWLKVLGFYIYIFGYLLLWVCDINYNHIVIN